MWPPHWPPQTAAARNAPDKRTNVTERTISAGEIIKLDYMYRIDRRSFWCSLDVIRSTFDEDKREKRLLHFSS